MAFEDNPTKVNASVSITFTVFEVRSAFLRWLADGHSKEHSPKSSILCMDRVSEYAMRKKIFTISLWSITSHHLFSEIYSKILANKFFRIADKDIYTVFTKVGRLYLRFLKEKAYVRTSVKNDDLNIEIQENKKNSMPLNANTLTIVEAVSEVIKKYGGPLTVKQIYEGILRAELYSFGAKNPLHVVNNVVRSYCEGVDWGRYSRTKKAFKITLDENGNSMYSLLDETIPPLAVEMATEDEISSSLSVETFESGSEKVSICADFIKSKKLNGATLDEISHLLQESRSKTIKMLERMLDIIECPKGTYLHSDSFVDLEEAREIMLNILRGHFSRFYGFSSSKILYEAARIQMDIFLNDNDLDDEMKIYYLALYFFSKTGSENFVFYFNWQIWEKEPDESKSTQGLLIRLAKRSGGFLSRTDAENLLGQLRLSINLPQALGLYQASRDFWQFSEKEYLYAPNVGLNEEKVLAIGLLLERLFSDNPDEHFIILRDISDEWMMMLPALPMDKSWTPLLLQETIAMHTQMGFKTIKPELNQSLNTIHAAITPKESHIVTFSDVVWEYLHKGYTLPLEFTAEDLRRLLREAGMIAGNELIYNMHKALNDYRFAWKNNNAHVRVLAI